MKVIPSFFDSLLLFSLSDKCSYFDAGLNDGVSSFETVTGSLNFTDILDACCFPLPAILDISCLPEALTFDAILGA